MEKDLLLSLAVFCLTLVASFAMKPGYDQEREAIKAQEPETKEVVSDGVFLSSEKHALSKEEASWESNTVSLFYKQDGK